ncbi:GNAT family N-acetyltransferase [Micromonospora sp. CPCC 206061]|uniref:GNAT family N-acetyltransferase n=1 Tax=Micromonospora sp. CPCC 206061 TaxID=3122410 RepID=UPI002FF37CE7
MISALTKRDLAACSSLYTETFNAAPWNESWRLEDATQRLRDILATPRVLGVSVSTSEGELVGFALGHLERYASDDHFLLQEMCVKPARQRQGVGTALLEALRDRMPEVRHWYLVTMRDGVAAEFYKKNGFRPAGRTGILVWP